MSKDIDSINHVGIMVHDINQATQAFEKMGFALTPPSIHMGAKKPGDPIEPIGSGNVTAMFPRNYVEILANINPTKKAEHIIKALAKYEGAHIICFGCGDADFVNERVNSEGIETSGVVPLQRDVDTPSGVRTARFSRFFFEPSKTPEGMIQAAYHHTPEYIHQERYLEHPNKVVALSDLYICADDPQEFAQRYEKYTGYSSERRGELYEIELPLSKLTIVGNNNIKNVLPGVVVPSTPSIVGIGFSTEDLEEVRSILASNKVSSVEQTGKIYVPPSEACGCLVTFEKSN